MLRSQSCLHFPLLACLVVFLTACAGNKTLEKVFAPDPKLQENSQTNTSSPTRGREGETGSNELPDNFPENIPRYPEAELVKVTSLNGGKVVETKWQSSAAINIITSFYQQKLQEDDWEIVKPASPSNNEPEDTITALRDDLQVKVAVAKEKSGSDSEFTIQYQQVEKQAQNQGETPPKLEATQTQIEKKPEVKTTEKPQTTTIEDLDRENPQVSQYIQDLAKLNVLTVTKSEDDNPEATTKFEPGKNITRREFARWLLTANNELYQNSPGKKIRPSSKSEQPAFQDVGKNDADFAVIQGLAQAGLIPSPLTGNSTEVLFRPDAPLTRQDLLLWKIPLDTRKALPKGTVEAVRETWGFQDAADISPQALGAVLEDFNNGDNANIRRMFGYTTLFQPKKPVNRGEAASALWYFGEQGEGISAQDVLKAKD